MNMFKQQQLSPRFAFGIAFLLVGLALRAAGQTIGDMNEVWISARTNALGSGFMAGSGAITDPYYGDFDATINSLPTNTTIHLLPGVFYTKGYAWKGGDPRLKAGQRLLGAGVDTTIIRKDNRFHHDDGQLEGVVWSQEGNIEVANLTIDCSGNKSFKYKIDGVGLYGSNNSIRRVKVINWCGDLSNKQEAWAIFVGGIVNGGYDTSNNMISGCSCSMNQGTYDEGIMLQGQGIVENNYVTLPAKLTGGGVGYMTAFSKDALFFGNICDGGNEGFYTDTGSETNLTIMANTFKNVANGIRIWKFPDGGYSVDGVAIKDNTIELATNAAPSWYHGISFINREKSWQPWQRIRIIENTVRYSNGGSPSAGVYTMGIQINASVIPTNIVNVQVRGNIVDRLFSNNCGGAGLNIYDNFDLNGNLMRNIAQAQPANPRARTRVNTMTYNAGYGDSYIGIKYTNTTYVYLPSAIGYPGKEYTIEKEVGSSNAIYIVPVAPGERINGVASTNFNGSWDWRTVISDGANWSLRGPQESKNGPGGQKLPARKHARSLK